MTTASISKIMMLIEAAYPQAMLNIRNDIKKNMIGLWSSTFREYDDHTVLAAVEEFIKGDTSGFPPTIGQINSLIFKTKCIPSDAAWYKVKRALSKSARNSKEAFYELDDLTRLAVGSPAVLKSWCMMDMNMLETVAAKRFMTSYQNEINNNKFLNSGTEESSKMIGNVEGEAEDTFLIEAKTNGASTTRQLERVNAEEIQSFIKKLRNNDSEC